MNEHTALLEPNTRSLAARLNALRNYAIAKDGRLPTWTEISRIAGVTSAAVSLWLKKDDGISAISARKLGKHYGVNPIWIETGVGSATNSETRTSEDDPVILKVVEIMKSTDDRGRLKILIAVEDTLAEHTAFLRRISK